MAWHAQQKVAQLPSGSRADRVGAVITALNSCEPQPGKLSMRTLKNGDIVIYRHAYVQQ